MCGHDPLSCIFDQKNFNDKFLMLEEEENFLETHFDFFFFSYRKHRKFTARRYEIK